MPVNVADTLAGLDAMGTRLEDAAKTIAGHAAHIIQAASMKMAPVGVPGNSTNAPGDLRRSIDVEGPFGGAGLYTARVGPTVIYGRQRELGGEIFPKHSAHLAFHWGKYPMGYWGTIPTLPDGRVLVHHVFQHGAHYMQKGLQSSDQAIEAMTIKQVEDAIAGTQ